MKKLVLVGLILFIATHTWAREPKWFKNSSKSGYSTRQYFIGYGLGKNYEEAITHAQADIAGQLETKIHASIVILDKENESSGTHSIKRDATSEISSFVKSTLKGMQISRRAKRETNHYILATLNKKKFSNSLDQQIKKTELSSLKTLRLANKELNKHNILASISLKNQVYEEQIQASRFIGIYNMITRKVYVTPPEIIPASIKADITDTLHRISVHTIKGNHQIGEIGQALHSIIFEVTLSQDEKNLPVANIPISISYGDKSHISSGITNEKGQFSVQAVGIPLSKNKQYIEATIYIKNLHDRWQSDFNQRTNRAYFVLDGQNEESLQVAIQSDNKAAITIIEEKIKELGFSIGNSGPKIHISFQNISDEEFSTIFSKKTVIITEATFILTDENNAVVGVLRSRGKGIHKKRDVAIKHAQQKIKINKQDFYELISRLDNKEN